MDKQIVAHVYRRKLISHEFTTTETWNALSGVTGGVIKSVTVDATTLTEGRLRVMVDGVLKAIVSHGSKDYRIFKPSSSLSIVAEPDEYDVSTASYDSNFSLTNIGAMDIAFNTDGTKCLYQDPIMETVLF